ncbi:MAG TPA: SEC-C metal-binding domain-containing protein [Candidatus Competibacteraceae bacterium]|nr:SEC-C metal-binding domain-containing protein [Candidatus Competibacteraceae bacterium]
MKRPGRNDPCPCGSGKKYKQCCLRAAATPVTSGRFQAVVKALDWLMKVHGPAVRASIDEAFFRELSAEENEQLRQLEPKVFEGIMVNAMEWLLAEGYITVKGQERRVAELLLGRGGPLLSAEQRQWIELLTSQPLGLYEVIEVAPGVSMRLKDVLFPEQAPVLVRERAGSQQAVKFDLMAARIIPIDGHFELSGAVYLIPRHRSLEMITALKQELAGVAPDSAAAKAILGAVLPAYWLKLLANPQLPQLVDQVTGEPILLITDHYRVHDWAALEQAMASAADIEGNREMGWSRLFEGKDGLQRRSLSIEMGLPLDRIKVFYRTQGFADQGRPWFEGVTGQAVTFISREIVDPAGRLAKGRPEEVPKPSPSVPMSPEVITEVIGNRIRQLYAN